MHNRWLTIPQTKYTGGIHLGIGSHIIFLHVLQDKAIVGALQIRRYRNNRLGFSCQNWRPLYPRRTTC